jgi:hypothetical protein
MSRLPKNLLLALLLVTPPAFADGNQLLSQCTTFLQLVDGTSNGSTTSLESFGAGTCAGMLQGITTTNKVYESTGRSKDLLMCLPRSGIQNGQAARVVVSYLNDHPQDLHGDEVLLATLALRDAFPCTKAAKDDGAR